VWRLGERFGDGMRETIAVAYILECLDPRVSGSGGFRGSGINFK
jgi:hypothetical protein